MAVKTITIDMEAYDALRRHKGAGQSFSDVIKAHFRGRTTGSALLRVAAELHLDPSTLDAIDEVIEDRSGDQARAPEL
jgi:predicted CopG family antitoxin